MQFVSRLHHDRCWSDKFHTDLNEPNQTHPTFLEPEWDEKQQQPACVVSHRGTPTVFMLVLLCFVIFTLTWKHWSWSVRVKQAVGLIWATDTFQHPEIWTNSCNCNRNDSIHWALAVWVNLTGGQWAQRDLAAQRERCLMLTPPFISAQSAGRAGRAPINAAFTVAHGRLLIKH